MGPQIPRGAPPLSGFRAGKAGESQPPLLLRLREALALRHYSASTVDAYAAWVRRFIIFHDRMHPAQMGAAEVTAFLSSLATEKSVSAYSAAFDQSFRAHPIRIPGIRSGTRSEATRQVWSGGGLGIELRFQAFLTAHRGTAQRKHVSVVNEAVADGVRDTRIAERLVPSFRRQL